jgi:hypothetical protein
MTEKRPRCRVCAAKLAVPATGRTPTYCSIGCRRSVEYELTRANRRAERLQLDLDRLDRRLAEHLVHPPLGASVWKVDRTERATTADQLAAAEARIRELLDVEE